MKEADILNNEKKLHKAVKYYRRRHLRNFFIWLCWVLVAALGISNLHCTIRGLSVAVCGIQFPNQGSNPCPLQSCAVSTTEPPGKPLDYICKFPKSNTFQFFINNRNVVFLVTEAACKAVSRAAINRNVVFLYVLRIVNSKYFVDEIKNIFSFLVNKQRGKHNI